MKHTQRGKRKKFWQWMVERNDVNVLNTTEAYT